MEYYFDVCTCVIGLLIASRHVPFSAVVVAARGSNAADDFRRDL